MRATSKRTKGSVFVNTLDHGCKAPVPVLCERLKRFWDNGSCVMKRGIVKRLQAGQWNPIHQDHIFVQMQYVPEDKVRTKQSRYYPAWPTPSICLWHTVGCGEGGWLQPGTLWLRASRHWQTWRHHRRPSSPITRPGSAALDNNFWTHASYFASTKKENNYILFGMASASNAMFFGETTAAQELQLEH